MILAALAMELAFGLAAGAVEFTLFSRRHPEGRAEFTAEHRSGFDLDQRPLEFSDLLVIGFIGIGGIGGSGLSG